MTMSLFALPPVASSATHPIDRAKLAESCLPMCRALARKMCPPDDSRQRREHRVEDIAAEAMLYLWEVATTFDPTGPAKFSTVAYAYISKRLRHIIDEQRLASQHATGADMGLIVQRPADGPESDDDHEADDEDSDGAVSLTDDHRDLMQRLPAHARRCVMLVLSGFTPEQAATQLGMATKDVKLVIRNAAKVLSVEQKKMGRPNLFAPADALHEIGGEA